MSPEQRALDSLRNQGPWDAFMAALMPFVAEQIRLAVEAEREACARTAEGWGTTFDGADGLCRGIAADIRARSKS